MVEISKPTFDANKGSGGDSTVSKRVIIGRNPDTGKPYFGTRIVHVGESSVPSVDELPPAGVNGPLSNEPVVRKEPVIRYDRGNYNADLTAPKD